MRLKSILCGFVMTPFVDQIGHVLGPLAVEEEAFAGAGMGEAEGFGVKYLARTKGETILDILAVFLGTESFENLTTAVFLIAEKGMTDILHVYADLVGTSGLESALDKRDIWKTFEHTPVRDCFFGLRTLFDVPHFVDRAVTVVTG